MLLIRTYELKAFLFYSCAKVAFELTLFANVLFFFFFFLSPRISNTLMCEVIGQLKPLIFHLSQMENLWFLGVPILKHIMVINL